MTKISKALREFQKRNMPIHSFVARVTAVDENKFTCDVKPVNGDAEYLDVRLKPTIDSDDTGFITIPEVNSFVVVGIFANNENHAIVTTFTKAKKHLIKLSDNQKLEFKDNGDIVFNDGTNEGLVIVGVLTQVINNLQTQHNKLLLDYTVHIHSDPLSGTTGTLMAAPTSTSIVLTMQSEIENTKVKH